MVPASPYILCVDDDEDDLFFITSFIQKEYPLLNTQVATNGEEALRKLLIAGQNNTLPILLLLDINMPRMNGKEVLSSIKADSQLRGLPVVVFTTSNSPADKLFFAHYGVDMVTKPETVSDLERVLQKTLNHAFYL